MKDLQCETIQFPSADGRHTVSGYLYTVPGTTPRAVLQLSHGMCEYVQRYRPVAEWYAAHGIALAGNDHLGHGATAAGDYGHYGEKNGRRHLLDDLHTMNAQLHERLPGVPVIMYGHSMGSFYARWYAETWPESIHALILSGTAGPSVLNRMGWVLAGCIAAVRGPHFQSKLMVKLQTGNYCSRIPDATSRHAWLSRDAAQVAAYEQDPQCGFAFTAGSYREMLVVLCHISSKQWAQNMNKDLPVLLLAGDGDPVGNYGAGVRAVWQMLGDAGVRDLTCQIWEGARHELHNEQNREEVFEYTLAWIEDRLPGMAKG